MDLGHWSKHTTMQKIIVLLADEPSYDYQALMESNRLEYLHAQIDYLSFRPEHTLAKSEISEIKIYKVSVDSKDEFYTLEKLDQLEDKSMYRLKHINFRKNLRYEKAYGRKYQDKGRYSWCGSRINIGSKSNLFDTRNLGVTTTMTSGIL